MSGVTLSPEEQAATALATRAVTQRAASLGDDPLRPTFHFGPRAGWMNDPNGTIWHDGWFHLFYQHNPFGDVWATMHWGHARSRDLLCWEHLPVALAPATHLGEDHCYSGVITFSPAGEPLMFYTSIAGNRSPEQWLAVGSTDLQTWHRPANQYKFLTLKDHVGMDIKEWRDPFVFTAEGRTLMVLGGKLTDADGGDGAVLIYEAACSDLLSWVYRGVLYRHPDKNLRSAECPNFFPLDGRWVLLLSPFGPIEYVVGDFNANTLTFTPRAHGVLDTSHQLYATNIWNAPDARTILAVWCRGFPEGRGWNGCLALPRELSIDHDAHLVQRPHREFLANLRPPMTTRMEGSLRPSEPINLTLTSTSCVRIQLSGRSEIGIAIDDTPRRYWRFDVAGEAEIVVVRDATLLEILPDHGPSSTVTLSTCQPLRVHVEPMLNSPLKVEIDVIEIKPMVAGGTE